MKKNFIIWLVVSAVIMLLLPWLSVTFIKSDAGMAACFILFYAVNPVYSVITGAFAGKDIKHLWNMPVILAVMFLSGTWLFFTISETAFIMYAVIYLVLWIVSMLVCMLVHRKIR